MYKILIPEDIAQSGKQYLIERGYELKVGVSTDLETLKYEIGDADGLIVRNARYPKEVLEAGKRLKVIGRHGTGVDNIAVKDAELLGIQVVNGPVANINAVAEYTVGLILALSCGLVQADRRTRDIDWTYRLSMERHEIRDKTLGLVGFGRIGQLVAHKVISALGMKVIAYDIHSDPQASPGIRFTRCLEEVLYEADFVSLHIPSTSETKGMFDYQMFSMMKEGAFFVNCARGDVYVEEDLVRVLKEGHLKGAALDVYRQEPLTDSPLLDMEQVILSQHNSGLSEESKDGMSLYAAMGVDQVLTGKTPTWPVNRPQKLNTLKK